MAAKPKQGARAIVELMEIPCLIEDLHRQRRGVVGVGEVHAVTFGEIACRLEQVVMVELVSTERTGLEVGDHAVAQAGREM